MKSAQVSKFAQIIPALTLKDLTCEETCALLSVTSKVNEALYQPALDLA